MDQRLLAALLGMLALAAGSIVFMALRYGQRQHTLVHAALERSQQMVRVRTEAFFMGLSQDLREEAEAVREWDGVSTDPLIERWRPLLATHWAIRAIAVADELGNEHALMRDSAGIFLRVTMEGSKEAPPIVHRVPIDPRTGPVGPPVSIAGPRDPRARVWFNKALEDHRNEPVWHMGKAEDGVPPLMRISYLVRRTDPEAPYRIIVFRADPGRSPWLDARSSSLGRFGFILMDGDGNLLNPVDRHKDPRVVEAERIVAERWRTDKESTPFFVRVNGREYGCQVIPYHLNGETLYTGALIHTDLIAAWTRTERRGLVVMGVLLLAMMVLTTMLWLGRRRELERVRHQARRSRSQEMRLAKALGEREVLNREVHHRVKNNLQVVSSLLSLQASRLHDGPVRDEFLRGKLRIDTMALVHHKLYSLKDLRNVDLDLFLRPLMASLAGTYAPTSRTVSHEVDTNGIQADQDTAITLGLILCELVGNAYRHAFPYATGGHIDVHVRVVEGDLHRLIVKDNGKGLADGDSGGAGKLGLEIVDALADQLDGSFHKRTNGGTTFEVLFRMRHDPSAAGNDVQEGGEG